MISSTTDMLFAGHSVLEDLMGIRVETFRLKGLVTEFYLKDVGPYQYDFSLKANRDQIAKR
uniref:Uncharacterized protein n=1 Tax=Romanomermis culicivorax TaxID=13658 RepID=A0A915L6H0_ROMCU